jgi:hypothetical protein
MSDVRCKEGGRIWTEGKPRSRGPASQVGGQETESISRQRAGGFIRPAHLYPHSFPIVIRPFRERADGVGFDASSVSSDGASHLRQSPNQGEAESEAVDPQYLCIDPMLAIIVEVWPSLTPEQHAAIMAIVEAGE